MIFINRLAVVSVGSTGNGFFIASAVIAAHAAIGSYAKGNGAKALTLHRLFLP